MRGLARSVGTFRALRVRGTTVQRLARLIHLACSVASSGDEAKGWPEDGHGPRAAPGGMTPDDWRLSADWRRCEVGFRMVEVVKRT